ncbi:MAG: glycosyltransferase family 2 protein [Prevotellaceae bacterium]|nr:glycosyltransferase family 2 protein [Prevotellaceae bacterium]
MKRIALVILNWNGAAMLQRFLPTVIARSGEAEVIVADNGSTDHSCAMLEKDFPGVRLVRLGRNYGFAEGYNRALAGLEHEFLLLLNSDVEPSEGWLRPLLDFMDARADVAAVMPKVLAADDRTRFEHAGAAGGFIDALGYPYCRGRVFGCVERDKGQYDSPCDVFWTTGAAMMVRRADWTAAGGLDGRFFAHQEEIDLCWRLRSRGRRLACVPASRVWHVGGGSLAYESPRKTFLNFRNNLLLLYKNLPEAELRRTLRRRRWLDALAALQFLMKGQAANFLAVRRARRAFRKLRPDFAAQREENLRLACTDTTALRQPASLLFDYYFRGRRTFMQLHAEKEQRC